MKKFLVSTGFFLIPLLVLWLLTELFYSKSGGDLNRLGKISVVSTYRNSYQQDFRLPIKFHKLSDVDFTGTRHFDALLIGDSFSRQGNVSFQNFLAQNENMEILEFDNEVFKQKGSELQIAFQLANGDIFDHLSVSYVILQIVQRNCVEQQVGFNPEKSFTVQDIIEFAERPDYPVLPVIPDHLSILTDSFKFPLYSLLYLFNDRAFFSHSYKVTMSKDLFTVNGDRLLFYFEDIKFIKRVTRESVSKLNDRLNELAAKLHSKGIQLIFLPSPDKYDMYRDYMIDNSYPENPFFYYMKDAPKNYIYLDARELLSRHIQSGEKDIYYADDTHWSPKGAKIIAEELHSIIRQN